ncbi:MAG: TonB-dependent receptor plug domain-containing protein [Planctomycetaceae bacterium]|nr:TonB-dependent receptor plug domain-containing protein [Planctomycetaceae bacterium]
MKRLQSSFCSVVLVLAWAGAVAGQAADTALKTQTLFDMSLSELMNVEIVPATITETNPLKMPASVTVITAQDIAVTPARNLLDLIEIYVPGAFYMNHSIGPVPGIRGIIADRPYKFLVNVNGINVNIKAHYGARLELLNWDLNDIERVEIVRGPGSVTYGPGAIGGVINIITRQAANNRGLAYGGHFWDRYDSIGNYLSYGLKNDKIDLYTYLSVVHTSGHSPDLFGVDSSSSGYLGHENGPYDPSPVFTYLSDYDNEPQIKAHVDVHFKDTWRFWARYVTSSYDLTQGSSIKYDIDGDGDYEDFRQTRNRYFQLALENNTPLNDEFSLKSTFGLSSIDVHNVEKYSSSIVNDRDSLQNIGWIWSEWEYFGRVMLNYDSQDDFIKAAVGAEASYDLIRPGWGLNENDGLRLSDGIISGPSSEAYGTGYRQVTEASSTYFAVGEGWETTSHAFLGEVNINHTPKTTTIWSARVDKHSYTDYMFSPRFAWIYELDPSEYLKFIAQRSVRMNTQEELFMSHELGEKNKPEKLDTLELIYSNQPTEHFMFQTSAFYNSNEVIAWDWNLRRSAPVGKLKTFGLEFESQYKRENWNIGLNHSFVKQLDWELGDDITVSGISYSDYFQDAGGGVLITSKGNDLNNWPNNMTKLFTNINLYENKLTLHGDLRTIWGFEGSKDGLSALARAGGNMDMIDHINDQDAYDLEITANLSLTYHYSKSADLTFFVHNIPVLGDNKRYSYSSGFKKSYPDKVAWIEEPTVVGVRWNVRF